MMPLTNILPNAIGLGITLLVIAGVARMNYLRRRDAVVSELTEEAEEAETTTREPTIQVENEVAETPHTPVPVITTEAATQPKRHRHSRRRWDWGPTQAE